MKSALASITAMVVLAAGIPAVNANEQLLPRWFCDMFPVFCQGR